MNKIVLRNIVVYVVLLGIGLYFIFNAEALSSDNPQAMQIIGGLLIALGLLRIFIYSKVLKDKNE